MSKYLGAGEHGLRIVRMLVVGDDAYQLSPAVKPLSDVAGFPAVHVSDMCFSPAESERNSVGVVRVVGFSPDGQPLATPELEGVFRVVVDPHTRNEESEDPKFPQICPEEGVVDYLTGCQGKVQTSLRPHQLQGRHAITISRETGKDYLVIYAKTLEGCNRHVLTISKTGPVTPPLPRQEPPGSPRLAP